MPVTIPSGSTSQETATGTYSDLSTQDLTNQCDWQSSNLAVATVGNGEVVTVPQPSNPDFEGGSYTGWESPFGGFSVIDTPLLGFSPRAGSWMGVIGDFLTGTASQIFRTTGFEIAIPAAVPSVTYQLRLWVGFAVDGASPGYQKCWVTNVALTPLVTVFDHTPAINAPGVWSELVVNVTPYAGTNINLLFEADAAAAGTRNPIFFDGLSVTRTPTTNSKGLVSAIGSPGQKAVITAKFPGGPAGATVVTVS